MRYLGGSAGMLKRIMDTMYLQTRCQSTVVAYFNPAMQAGQANVDFTKMFMRAFGTGDMSTAVAGNDVFLKLVHETMHRVQENKNTALRVTGDTCGRTA
jgi:hypothetical protein